MTKGKTESGRTVLRFRHSDLVIGAKFWWACLIAGAIIVLGVWVTPQNGLAGLGIGVAGVLGGVLGTLLQTTPRERDLTANGASAVRGLLGIAQDVENAQLLATQLSQISPKSVRLTLGLVDVQNRLQLVREEIYSAMAEWDSIAPGSLEEVNRMRDEGRRAFALLAKETS